MAQRYYESLLEPDRDNQLATIYEQMAARGASEDRHNLDKMMNEFAGSEWAALASNPMSAGTRYHAELMRTAMLDLDFAEDRIATLTVGSALTEDVTAQMRPFADGSGLVLVSDSISSLCYMYASHIATEFAAILERGDTQAQFELARASQRGTLDDDASVLTGLLRYYNVHQRVFGLAGKLGRQNSDHVDSIAAMLATISQRFVLGHEMAHHILGHDSQPSGFFPDMHLPACSGNQQKELDADALAFRAADRSFHREFSAIPELANPETLGSIEGMTALGALIAMAALHSTETALFVRCGNSHPPAPARAAQLLQTLHASSQSVSQILMGNILTATIDSSSFSDSASPFHWPALANVPGINSPHPQEYLQYVGNLDALQCQPRQRLLNMLEQEELPRLTAGAHHAYAGDTHEALRIWGVSDDEAQELHDVDQPLTFHSLLTTLRAGFKEEIPDAAQIVVSLTAARLIEDPLAAKPNQA